MALFVQRHQGFQMPSAALGHAIGKERGVALGQSDRLDLDVGGSRVLRMTSQLKIQIDGETIWPADSDVDLDEDLVVSSSLRIEHGVIVTAADGVGITVVDGGALEVAGIAPDPVFFTTLADDRWTGLTLKAGGMLRAHHAVLEHLVGAGVLGVGAEVHVVDSVVRDVAGGSDGAAFGIALSGGSARVAGTREAFGRAAS